VSRPENKAEHGVEAEFEGAVRASGAGRLRGERLRQVRRLDTIGDALAANEEHTAGRIAPGYRADLTAFSVDPVTAPADEVAGAPIRLTMVDGAVTHRG
jgi:predicted amidohydrolase YtcJ